MRPLALHAHDFQHHHATARLHHPRHLAQRARHIDEVPHAKAHSDAHEAIVHERQRMRIPHRKGRMRAQTLPCRLALSKREHLRHEIQPHHVLDIRFASNIERKVSRPASHIQRCAVQPRADCGVRGESPPCVVHAPRHHRVQQVVPPRYAPEHSAHIARPLFAAQPRH